ncbi:MAG: serine/threonine-protein kinase, partial [Psychrobacillus psychrodurans]
MKKQIRSFFKTNDTIVTDFGEIKIKKEIGEGGNALVYDIELGRNEVALKILAEKMDSTKYKRFLTEFRELVQLADTKCVVPIYYFSHLIIERNKFPFMIMKKYPYTLKSWLELNSIADFDELLRIIKKLLDIVGVIHEKNIVHRDLKPENILVADDGDMVLADFGISWFDPEHYDRLVHTKKSDRMANYDFSAPEQFQKVSKPHTTMDIFALGQIITWIITGRVARGSRKSLTEIHKNFAILEPAISKMLSPSIEDRPQSIQEVRDILNNTKQQLDDKRKKQNEIDKVLYNLEKYDEVIRGCFPGKRGIIEVSDEEKIERLLNKFNEVAENTELWWTQGYSNMSIDKFKKIDSNIWVMDYTEIEIEKLWVYRNNHTMDYNFILLKTKSMEPFGIYEEIGYRSEEAAWFVDRYISRAEYDDGVAEIDGEAVWLNGKAELRVRELHPQYYFITTPFHAIGYGRNDLIIHKIYERLVQNGKLEEREIIELNKLEKHSVSYMLA